MRHAPRTQYGQTQSWVAVAVTMANNGTASGYARRSSAEEATAQAIEQCAASGRPGCYAPVAASTGCLYVSIAAEGSAYSAWGTSATEQEAMNQCQSQGVFCTTPIGGCG